MVDVSKIELSALIHEARISVKAAELGLHVFSMQSNASDFAEARAFLTQASAVLEEGRNALCKALEAQSNG